MKSANDNTVPFKVWIKTLVKIGVIVAFVMALFLMIVS